ncbi:MAG: monovalent cation/H+ antiporter subunit D [Paracoccus sp. (in: a-proteobacteria)]|nr:monovalent cation/H+ antiporter subunit D [Paracoccus sp. (in: a-proteobacteria)]
MNTTVIVSPEHLLILPLLIPLFAGALMLFYDDRRRWLKLGMGVVSVLLLLLVSILLVDQAKGEAATRIYLLGNWPMPMGIMLVLDRLSAMMVLLAAMLALPALIYTAAGWQGKGQHYHSLFQFVLVGLNGAFLTGDLFNLFVFFEVMLAASYGLMLHGSGPERIKAGLHYIAINLAASLLFLIGVAMIYGVAGTLNMAQLSRIGGQTEAEFQPLLLAGLSLMGVAFLVKAAVWPLCFWLPRTYAAASPPAAAIMAIMSKVGVYAVLRVTMLNFAPESGPFAGFGGPLLVICGIATMMFGLVGVLAARGLAMKAGHIALISSGTVISIIGFALIGGGEQMLAGALYYLVGSTLGVSALFLLAEALEREPEPEDEAETDDEGSEIADPLSLYWGPMGLGAVDDDDEPATTLPASVVAMGASFVILVAVLSGLPPFTGFIGKVAMITGMLREVQMAGGFYSPLVWVFIFTVFLSGFAVLMSLMRFGIARFWTSQGDGMRMLALESGPVSLLVLMLIGMTVLAQPAMRYTQATAAALMSPPAYAQAVLSTEPTPVEIARPEGEPAPEPSAPPEDEAITVEDDPEAIGETATGFSGDLPRGPADLVPGSEEALQ